MTDRDPLYFHPGEPLPKRKRTQANLVAKSLLVYEPDGLPKLTSKHHIWMWRRSLESGDPLSVFVGNDYRRPISPTTLSVNPFSCLVPYEASEVPQGKWRDAVVIIRTTTEIYIHILGGHPTRDHRIPIDALPSPRIRPRLPGSFTHPQKVYRPFVAEPGIHLPPFTFFCRLASFYPPVDAFQDFSAFLAVYRMHRVLKFGASSINLLQTTTWKEAGETRNVVEILSHLTSATSERDTNNNIQVVISQIQPSNEGYPNTFFNHYYLTFTIYLSLERPCHLLNLTALLSCSLLSPAECERLKQVDILNTKRLTWEEAGSNVHSFMHLHTHTGFQVTPAQLALTEQKIQTPLRDYQHDSVAFMVRQETSQFGISEVLGMPISLNGVSLWYTFHSQSFSMFDPHSQRCLHGGLLVDEFGLGKSLMIITLIALLPPPPSPPLQTECRKATLILMPTSLIAQWLREIKQHTHPSHPLSVLAWTGAAKTSQTLEHAAQNYDIVICSYATNIPPSIPWFRLVCDEGHRLTTNSELVRKVHLIDAPRRWIVTSTPVKNHVTDLRGISRVLGFENQVSWEQLRQLPHREEQQTNGNTSPNVVSKEHNLFLHLLFGGLMIRHLKDQRFNGRSPLLQLPEHVERTVRVPLNREEFHWYCRLHKRIERTMLVPSTFRFLIQVLPLREFCSGGRLPGHFFDPEGWSNMPAEDPSAPSPYNSIQEECAICYEMMEHPVQTACRHAFCSECLQTLLESPIKHVCPICREPIKAKELKRLLVGTSSSSSSSSSITATKSEEKEVKSKIEFVIRYYSQQREADPFIKIIIFTHFRRTQCLLADLLPLHGFRCFKLAGNMQPSRRQKEIDGFQGSKGSSVLLLSMRTGNCGLSLTSANHVCIFEPWINPSMDKQAINRVLRIGQTRPVVITRFVLEDTVEEILRTTNPAIQFHTLSSRLDELASARAASLVEEER